MRRKPYPDFRSVRLKKSRSESARASLGLTRVELVTSRLSGVRSNRLSYRPRMPGSQAGSMPAQRPYIKSPFTEYALHARLSHSLGNTRINPAASLASFESREEKKEPRSYQVLCKNAHRVSADAPAIHKIRRLDVRFN